MESNEQNELIRKIETDQESRLTAVRGRQSWKLGESEQKRRKKEKKIMDRDNSVVIAWGRGGGREYRGINGDGRRLDLGC